jgi:crotonobetainyl-CoA:carnitine CoA-transferase CaiB-like acyl-CoA transferase
LRRDFRDPADGILEAQAGASRRSVFGVSTLDDVSPTADGGKRSVRRIRRSVLGERARSIPVAPRKGIPRVPRAPCAAAGEHTRAILAEIGLGKRKSMR